MKRYWLTPPEIYKKLDDEFHFDFDPCPCPRPDGYNSLILPWGKSNYVNPPFCKVDGPYGGPTAFLKKAVEEQKEGKTSVIILPVRYYINIALEAGAEIRSAGRVRWLDVDTKEEWKSPHPAAVFILKGKKV
jgi:hypothetical protein